MRCQQRIFLAIIAAAAVPIVIIAAAELSVKVYDGPTECEDTNKVKSSDFIVIHYTGTIDESSETGEKGKMIESSHKRNEPFDFQIGIGETLQGLDEGIIGLCKNAKAKIVIPPDMGYGAEGGGEDIPGGATLNYDIEIIDVMDAPSDQPNYFQQIDGNRDGIIDKNEMMFFLNGQAPDGGFDDFWDEGDKNGDGKITWEEFDGPKGDKPPSPKSSVVGEL